METRRIAIGSRGQYGDKYDPSLSCSVPLKQILFVKGYGISKRHRWIVEVGGQRVDCLTITHMLLMPDLELIQFE